MQHLKLFVVIALGLSSPSVHAQDGAPPPPPPNPETLYPETPPPAPAAQEEAPAPPTTRAVVRPTTPVEAETPPAATAGFGLEVATTGFVSGALSGGLLLGVHISNGSLLGVRLDYLDETAKVGGMSRSKDRLALGLAARFPVVGSKSGLDLAVALDL